MCVYFYHLLLCNESFFFSLSLFLFLLFSTKTVNVATTISLPDLDFWSLGFYRSGSREQLHRHQLQARAWRWEATGWAPGSTNAAAAATATDWNGQGISTKTSHACNNNNNSNNIWDMVCCQTGSWECRIPRSFGLGLFSATRSRECGLQAHSSKSNLLPPQYLSKSCELGLQSVLSISWSCWLNLQFQRHCHYHIQQSKWVSISSLHLVSNMHMMSIYQIDSDSLHNHLLLSHFLLQTFFPGIAIHAHEHSSDRFWLFTQSSLPIATHSSLPAITTHAKVGTHQIAFFTLICFPFFCHILLCNCYACKVSIHQNRFLT